MWPKRSEQTSELHLCLPLEPTVVLDAADFLTRQSAVYGIRDHLELRRSSSGSIYDRHFVLCRPQGSTATRPSWVMQLTLGRAGNGDTRVDLGLHVYRRSAFGLESGRAAAQYRDLLREALRIATSARRTRMGNVIPLRPYTSRLAPSA